MMAREMKNEQKSMTLRRDNFLRFSKIFRIDTCTGETWSWNPVPVSKSDLGGRWEKIQENPEAHEGEGE